MKLETAIVFVLLWGLEMKADRGDENATNVGLETGEKLSRRKRYIVFPKGSSLQLLLEFLVHVPTDRRLVLGPTLQVAWPLPSERFEAPPSSGRRSSEEFSGLSRGKRSQIFVDLADLLKSFGMTVGLAWQLPDDPAIYSEFKKKHKLYKRNVFKKIEAYMRPGGADGQQCVLRALCESGQRTPSKKEFLREILHKIFSMEEMEEGEEDTPEDRLYRKAHQSTNQNCAALYPGCDFSIFEAIQ